MIGLPPQTTFRHSLWYAVDKGMSPLSYADQGNLLSLCLTDDDKLELLDFLMIDMNVHPASIIGKIKLATDETRRFALRTHLENHRRWKQENAMQERKRRAMPMFLAPQVAVG